MSIRKGYWELYAGAAVSTNVYDMTEGIAPGELGLSAATTKAYTGLDAWTTVFTYNLPDPPSGKIVAGTYEVIARASGSGTCASRWVLNGDAGAYTSTSTQVDLNGAARDVTWVITVATDKTYATWILELQIQSYAPHYVGTIYPMHGSNRFGTQAASTGTPRTAFSGVTYTPVIGTHAVPTAVATECPVLTPDLSFVYPDDQITLVKYADTIHSSAHSASGATTQTVGDADDSTDSFPSAGVRRIGITPDATRKCDAVTNTYYVVTVTDDLGGAVGTLAYEVMMDVVSPTLLWPTGIVASPTFTSELEPVVAWTDPNPETTHWRVRVYTTGDVLMWDSTETAVGLTTCQIPSSAALVSLTSYYVVVTVMKGAGGSIWSVNSDRGYFKIDKTSTGVKITSHEGTNTAAVVITTTTPTIVWTFPRTQQSFCVTAVDESDQSVDYMSGWIASAVMSHVVGVGLVVGKTYSIQVQVKDTIQQHVYAADKRAWVHTNSATISAPTLTAEPDTTDLVPVVLVWAAPAVTDGDVLVYDLEITRPSGVVDTYRVDVLTMNMGQLAIGTYSWRVRAVDEHGMLGTWSAADTFIISAYSGAPIPTWVPWGPSLGPIVNSWSYVDAQGRVQDAYDIDIASDVGFVTIVESTGIVVSGATSYTSGTLAAGHYWRRVKLRAGGADWTVSWVTDEVDILAATAQSLDFELFRLHSDGILSKIWEPASGISLTRRLDGPGDFQFSVGQMGNRPCMRGLVTAWLLDEVSGAVAHDIVGVNAGTVAVATFGNLGYIRLQGDTQYIRKEDLTLVGADAFTVVLVVKVISTLALDVIWGLGPKASDTHGHRIAANADETLYIWTGDGTTATSGNLTVGALWVCIILWHDGTNLYLYRMDTATSVNLAAKNPVGTMSMALNNWPGTTKTFGPADAYYAAMLLHNVALTSAERTKSYKALQRLLIPRGINVL